LPTNRQYLDRKARGHCVICGVKAFANQVHCDDHRRKSAEYFASVRQKKVRYVCANPSCKKEFTGYGERRFCSRDCSNKAGNPHEKSKKGWDKRGRRVKEDRCDVTPKGSSPMKIKCRPRTKQRSSRLSKYENRQILIHTEADVLREVVVRLKSAGFTIGGLHDVFRSASKEQRALISSFYYGNCP